MSKHKYNGFAILQGHRIHSFTYLAKPNAGELKMETSIGNFHLSISDDGYGGNDSHAFLSEVIGLNTVLHSPIEKIEEDADKWGATIKLHDSHGNEAVVKIVHEQNGYYGFGYSLERIDGE